MKLFEDIFCNDMDEAMAGNFLAKLGKDMWPASTNTETDWRYDHLDADKASYILCTQDRALTPARQEVYASRFHAGRVRRIDAGHQVMNSQPTARPRCCLPKVPPDPTFAAMTDTILLARS